MTVAGFAIAAGHPAVAQAGAEILRDGGNAFDATLAAMAMACVAEPVLASLAGGGFMLAAPIDGPVSLIDFFAATPSVPKDRALDFRHVEADFGPARQSFHIGWGSVAVPGMIPGLFDIHARFASRPMQTLLEPAQEAARQGLPLRAFDAFVLEVVRPIITASEGLRTLFCKDAGALKGEDDLLIQSDLADSLALLGAQGLAAYTRGDLGQIFLRSLAEQGGLVGADDLAAYRVYLRAPLVCDYRGARFYSNPTPSIGGRLIAAALQALLKQAPQTPDSAAETLRLALTAREADHLRLAALKGTTHISVVDGKGNAAAVSLSNGEGMGDLIPGTGIMPNNMLGEADLNPEGFHTWQPGLRLTSMMAPSLLLTPQGGRIVLGSGGSSRIRSAVLQAAVQIIDHGRDLEGAIAAPRLHVDGRRVDLESGFAEGARGLLEAQGFEVTPWPGGNLYFGGVHAAGRDGRGLLCAAGDPRRGGVGITG